MKPDTKFLDFILKYKNYYEEVGLQSQQYKIELEHDNCVNPESIMIISGKEYKCYPIGYIKDNVFTWKFGQNIVQRKHLVETSGLKDYVSQSTLDYLFSDQLELEDKYKLIIPYLLGMINPAYNVIEFRVSEIDNLMIFMFINLGIKDGYLLNVDELKK